VAEARVDATRAQRLGAEGGRRVAARDDVAALGQQPGQRGQPAAADADAVDVARQAGRGLHGPAPAAASTTSATRRAASGRLTLSAAALIAGSRAGPATAAPRAALAGRIVARGHVGAAHLHQRAAVGLLVMVGVVRVGHEDGGRARDGQLRDRAAAGAAHGDVGGAVDRGHVLHEALAHHGHARGPRAWPAGCP
jgi:hypothetical protein